MTVPNTIEFNNPQEIDDSNFSDIIGLDFNRGFDPEPDPIEEKNQKKTVVENKSDSKVEEEEEKEKTIVQPDPKTDSKTGLELNPENEEEESTTEVNYLQIINNLANRGIIKSAYEGFDDTADPTEETLIKLLEYNYEINQDQAVVDFFESLSEKTKQIVRYDLNAEDGSIEDYIKSVVKENNIKSLTLEDEYDQEKIVRQWYTMEDKFSEQEVDEKITELKDAALLSKEAARLKPKLDAHIENQVKQREAEQNKLLTIKKQASEEYNQKVLSRLQTGKIGEVTLSKEEAGSLHAILNDDPIEITSFGGKKIKMSPLEAIIYFHRYNEKGNIDALLLSALQLVNPEKFEQVYANKAKTEVTTQFVKDQKYSSALKTGGGQSASKEQKRKIEYSWSQPS